MIIKLPTGFSASAGTDYATSALTSAQISDGGKTITITGLNQARNDQIMVSLRNKTMPSAGTYEFEIYFDADGSDSTKDLSDASILTYTIIN